MTTCFATVAALASHSETIGEDDVVALVRMTPQERLGHVAERLTEVSGEVAALQEDYAWFMNLTGQTEEQLRSGFEDHDQREARFARANAYGDKMFDLLRAIAERSPRQDSEKFLRYLVI